MATSRTEFVNVQPAHYPGVTAEPSQAGGRGRWKGKRRKWTAEEETAEGEEFGIPGHGLSEPDFMVRQRYLENSGLQSACSHAVSIASQPLEPNSSSSMELCHFIQEQRKIISTFRSQPWPMQMKQAAVKSYRQSVSKYVTQLNTLDMLRDSMRQTLRRLRRNLNVVVESLTIWSTIIHHIEGNFGTSVASFFTFLRWLCALNLSLTAIVLGFLIIPQVTTGHGLDVPHSVKSNGSSVGFFVDGKGYLFEYSVLFYGFYDSGQDEPYHEATANPRPYIGLKYRLPLAYILVVCMLFVFTIALLLFSMAEKYKLLQRASAGEWYPFSWKVFASWDYAITRSETAANKKRQIIVSLKETIVEHHHSEHGGVKVWHWLIRILTNLLVIISLAGTSYAIFLAVENAEKTNSARDRNFQAAVSGGWNDLWLFIRSFQVQFVIVCRNFLLPFVFMFAEFLEKLHPRTALKLMLMRVFLLYLSSLFVLIIALFTHGKECKPEEGEGQDPDCCWETMIGQELYKLSLTHLSGDLANIVIVDGLRWLVNRLKCCSRIRRYVGPAEFRLADNVLKVVYSQALVLLGVLFCPLLPAIGFLKTILLFYCRAFAVYFFNKPPRILFRVASTRNFYMALLLLTTFLCVLPVGYAIVEMAPSMACGPFRGLSSMVAIIPNEIGSWPVIFRTVFDYMQTATVIIPVLTLMMIIIYYYGALSHALKEVNKDLRLQLRVEQNETRERIAQEVRPKTTENRHQELQKAIQAELRERQLARAKRSTQRLSTIPSGSEQQDVTPRGPNSPQGAGEGDDEPMTTWGLPGAGAQETISAVHVNPPQVPTQGTR